MKKCGLICWGIASLFFSHFTYANHHLYQDYEQFYRTYPDRIFDKQHEIAMPFSFTKDGVVINYWEGKINGKAYYIEITDGDYIEINQHPVKKNHYYMTKEDRIDKGSLDMNTVFYTSDNLAYKNMICLEGNIRRSSGLFSRHKTVYLIDIEQGNLIKLPALFASCQNARPDAKGNIAFLVAHYYNQHSAPQPEYFQGVVFNEYLFDVVKKEFIATPYKRFIKYPDQNNAYQFYEME